MYRLVFDKNAQKDLKELQKHAPQVLPKLQHFVTSERNKATEHPFFRMAHNAEQYDASDFQSYAELNPQQDWGEMLPLAVGLSLIDNESKARKNLHLPMFKSYKGIIALSLNPTDGVLKQTGVHRSHYTWWRTAKFDMSDLKMIEL